MHARTRASRLPETRPKGERKGERGRREGGKRKEKGRKADGGHWEMEKCVEMQRRKEFRILKRVRSVLQSELERGGRTERKREIVRALGRQWAQADSPPSPHPHFCSLHWETQSNTSLIRCRPHAVCSFSQIFPRK